MAQQRGQVGLLLPQAGVSGQPGEPDGDGVDIEVGSRGAC